MASSAYPGVMMQRTHWTDGVVCNKRLTAKGMLAKAVPNPSECSQVTTLLSKMLQLNPDDRPMAEELLQDSWLVKGRS